MEISESTQNIFFLSKVLALAPYSVRKDTKGVLIIQKSVPFIIYTSSIAMLMVVTALDVSVVVLAISTGVVCGLMGLNPTKELNKRMHKIDETISSFIDLKSERLKANILLGVPMITILVLLGLDIWSWLGVAEDMKTIGEDPELNVQWYLPFYGLYIVLAGLHVTFANTTLGLSKRFKCLNSMLKTSFLPAYQKKSNQSKGKVGVSTVKAVLENEVTLQESLSKLAAENYQNIGKSKTLLLKLLAQGHESLGKCIKLVASSYGLTILFILMSCFLHLVATAYFLCIELLKKDKSSVWLQVLWIIAHAMRLLMVVEPCHRVYVESMKTLHIVCEIQRVVHDSILAEEVKKFWQQLLVFDPCFSACGLCVVNRSLLASLSTAIATYLVIFIQFQRTNG